MIVHFVIFAALLVCPLIAVAQDAEKGKYIDYEFKGVVPNMLLPNGVRDLGGSLIGDVYADPVYAIGQVEKGKTKMLWLKVSTGKDDSGVTGWKVLDVLLFPTLAKADYLFFAGDPAVGCTHNGEEISNLVGVGRIVRTAGVFRPSPLWIANLSLKKFESYALAGVKCEYSEP